MTRANPSAGASPPPPHRMPSSLALVLAEIDAELLQLPVKMGPLEPRLFRYPRHAAVFARQMVFEIGALEPVAAIAQRGVEGKGCRRPRQPGPRQSAQVPARQIQR